MRTFILLTIVAMVTGCQHTQTCAVRRAGNCRDKATCKKPCDLSNACRQVQSSCQKVCQPPSGLGCKKPTLGWKEVRVPVLKLTDRQSRCVVDQRCRKQPSCDLGTPCDPTSKCRQQASCTPPTTGCCRELSTPPTEATPFLTVPAEVPIPQPKTTQRQGNLPQLSQPIASSNTTSLSQRTQALEAQVNELRSMLQQRQATNLPATGYIDPRSVPQKEVIMLPPPTWRTMDGVPPIPNSPIEQTGAYRSNFDGYRTASNPQMWPHSPQNLQRTVYR